MKRVSCSLAIVITMLLGNGHLAAAEDPRIENARQAFATLDENGDGKVTFEEFASKKIIVFSARDQNQNNSLDRDEVRITREQFDAIDENKDGKISGLEFLDSPFGRFETYDLDKNGVIDLHEFTEVLVGK